MPGATSRAKAWQPILAEPQAGEARRLLRSLALSMADRQPASVDLFGGSTGLALLFGYLAMTETGEAWDERAGAHLGRAMDVVGSVPMFPSLYYGFPGVAWVLEHLQGRAFEPCGEDPLAEMDELLLERLEEAPGTMAFELMEGVTGWGLYALERLRAPLGPALLARVLAVLEALGTQGPDGLTWLTVPRDRSNPDVFTNGHYNLGPAHGVAGVIGLLGRACRSGFGGDRALAMLERSVAWLWRQANPEGGEARFPNAVLVVEEAAHQERMQASRLGWCYGDLGISVALLGAARAVGRADWEARVLPVLRHCTERSLASAQAESACLCHGFSGIAHLFNRVYQATGEACFLEAARTWFDRTLAYLADGGGGAAFGADSPGFLGGATGLCLTLHAATSDVEPDWDHLLGFDLSPRGGQGVLRG